MKAGWVRVSLHRASLIILHVPFLFLAAAVAAHLFINGSTPSLPPPITACNYSLQTCGKLSIPYPFSMSPQCGLWPQYRILCKLSPSYGHGYLVFLQIGTHTTPELQVLNFSTNTLIVNSTHLKAMPKDCLTRSYEYGYAALELPENGPFMLDAKSNVFVVIGCNAEGSCNASTSDVISCTTSCYNEFNMDYCNYYSCCINALPPASLRLDFQGKGINYGEFPNVCGFSTVLSPSTFNIPPSQKGHFAAGHYGLSISWALQSNQNCSLAKQAASYACSDKADCIYDADIKGYTCNCTQGYRGDGYKAGIGCKDINECKEHKDECEKPPLGTCINTNGSYHCSCTIGSVGSGLSGDCTIPNHDKNLLIPVLLGGLGGATFLAAIIVFTWTSRRAYQKAKKRKENFRRNGGNELSSCLMFSEEQLIQATKRFSNDHVLGEGGFGKVYWGKLTIDGCEDRKVAIKRAKPKEVKELVAQIQSFVREISLLSKTRHIKNVVQLLGCCLETSVPLLVYEFVERGTLRDYLKPQSRGITFQGKAVRFGSSLLWAWRLHIAVETAEAVSFLHNMSEPIFHLDMKSANILIDKHYNPKVADFGLSCFLTSDATHLTNQNPAGTFGYVDPEYYTSLRVTDKCDVYSFGVVLLELISARLASQGPGLVLAHHFRTDVKCTEELSSFIDNRLGTDEDVLQSIQSVAELARRCVAVKGTDRPSMQEVVTELREIQSRNAGKLHLKSGGVCASLELDLAGPQELYGTMNYNNIESEDVAFFDSKRIHSDQFASSSSLLIATQTSASHSASAIEAS